VQSGVLVESGASQKFEVDGRPYVFSALRPEPAPAGSLKLRTINMTLLNVIVFGLIGLLGLVLVRARLTTQLAGALLVIAGLVFVGVFFPLVTEHLFSEAMLFTALLIGLVWLVFDVIRWFRCLIKARREFQASRPQPPVLATSAAAMPTAEAPDFTESPPPTEDSGSTDSDSSPSGDEDQGGSQ
jgi:hypothetical protein